MVTGLVSKKQEFWSVVEIINQTKINALLVRQVKWKKNSLKISKNDNDNDKIIFIEPLCTSL